MATTGNEYYLRSVLLLTKGGFYISKKVLYREVDNNGEDLDILLKRSEKKLRHQFHKKQCEKLFPATGNTNVKSWDLQMVIGVVQFLFRRTLSLEEREKLQILMVNRHDVLAHSSSASLDKEEYDDIQEQLKEAIIKLASGFDQAVKDKCSECITQCESGPLEIKSAVENMRKLQDNDAKFREVFAAIKRSEEHTRTEILKTEGKLSSDIKNVEGRLSTLEQTLMKMGALNPAAFQKKIKVGVHTELTLSGPSKKWTDLMESTLNYIFNEADKRATGGDFGEIKKTFEDFLQIIRDKANFKGSTPKCVLLEFECTTYENLQRLLVYFRSPAYQQELEKISMALMTRFDVDEQVNISSSVTPECLDTILAGIGEEFDEYAEAFGWYPQEGKSNGLQLAIECTSIEGLRHVWNLFQKGGATGYLSNIAEALSKHFGENVSLESHLDLDEFKAAIEKAEQMMAELGRRSICPICGREDCPFSE